ncbi:hypothetical protein DSL72_007653 [Monilinia vaccinii-corymbosi]|uniref:ribonuclease Z n=1 Tax=Monilinia vaccinii-corymbosi TaxID=61207 RepID=A0A8A3PID3_9HELO|nr:hypothetical protein DSL72_007653 [Monilinia vaccinii-corymbosi]
MQKHSSITRLKLALRFRNLRTALRKALESFPKKEGFSFPPHPARLSPSPTQYILQDRILPESPQTLTDPADRKRFLVLQDNPGNVYHGVKYRKPSSNLRTPDYQPGDLCKMRNYIQFLTTPTADTPGTTLLLHFDNKRYLIGNIAEGTQRACVQSKTSLMKVGELFVTGKVDWASTGGILGMILTLADATSCSREAQFQFTSAKMKRKGEQAEKPERAFLNIHGGENLTHLLATARRFIFRNGMPLYINEYRADREKRNNWDPSWSDEYIKVWAMAVKSEGNVKSPGKRSHDEFSDDFDSLSKEDQELKLKEAQELRDEEDRQHQVRKSVVSSMFDSDWKLDTLYPMRLKDVRMPAAIFVRDSDGKVQKYQGPKPGGDEEVPDIEVLMRKPWPGALVESLPPTKPSTSSVSYIIKNHAQRGKFNPKEAERLKVKRGVDYRTLTAGRSVIATDGTTVTPEQVLGEGKEGTGIAILEVPDVSYIRPLIAREELASKEVMSGVESVIWILGPDVLADLRLQKFMEEHKELTHIVSSPDNCSNYLAFSSAAAQAIRLHLLDSERFPIPSFSNTSVSASQPVPYLKAKLGKTLLLEPKFEIQDDKCVPYLDTKQVVTTANAEVLALASEAKKEVMSPEYQAKLDEVQKDIPCKDAEVITLGTGSALPSKYRNVSATLLRVPEYGNYLFDAGENTLGQMKRVFGKELPGVLSNLKAIWISHLHADHHLGTVSVIRAWHEETSKDEAMRNRRLVIASDHAMIHWLTEYSEVEDYGFERLKLVDMTPAVNELYEEFTPAQTKAFGLSSIEACQVSHCHGALAVAFNFPNGFKVAYSGDCRPSQDFVTIGKGATLLIHEATFDDELQGDAIAKKHSTTSEAMDVGKRMGARRILLTHFSQRYQKIPVMDNEATDQVAIVAFDYMKVKISDFSKIAAFRPALLKLYEEKE